MGRLSLSWGTPIISSVGPCEEASRYGDPLVGHPERRGEGGRIAADPAAPTGRETTIFKCRPDEVEGHRGGAHVQDIPLNRPDTERTGDGSRGIVYVSR